MSHESKNTFTNEILEEVIRKKVQLNFGLWKWLIYFRNKYIKENFTIEYGKLIPNLFLEIKQLEEKFESEKIELEKQNGTNAMNEASRLFYNNVLWKEDDKIYVMFQKESYTERVFAIE